ncbi:nuclear autoantigen Sp-100 [Sorex araneus]|uniref:nuclear autoantigen Sp-100 n=1 Tax=Sorex araneus TaxID=42254 RepID=UPI002433EC93|nr:nuclear autoantigen Sp-100 [Sorex araneus]
MMDGADGQLSTSILSENQDPDRISDWIDRLKHLFKTKKMEIAYAIKTTFPFLETLRDNELITNDFYEKLKHNEEVGVPVPRVVYDTLQAVEQHLDPQHLNIVFSDFHRKQYPKLELTYEAFKEVFSMIPCVQDGIGQDALEGSVGPLSLEQGIGEELQECLISASQNAESPDGATVHANGITVHPLDAEEAAATWKGLAGGERGVLESEQASRHCAKEPDPAGDKLRKYGIQSSSCFVSLVDIKNEKASFGSNAGCNQALEIIDLSSDDKQSDTSGGEESPKASTSAQKRKIGTTSLRKSPVVRKRRSRRVRRLESFSGSSGDEAPQMADAMDEDSDYVGNKSKCATDNKEREFHSDDSTEVILRDGPQETCSSALRRGSGVLRGQEARTGHSQASSMTDAADGGSNSVSREYNWRKRLAVKYKAARKQVKKRDFQTTKVRRGIKRGRSPINSKPKRKKRGPRIPKDKNMNFDVPELPVTCGEVKGTLYKEKFKTGTSSKCILREDGEAWLTLREFEIEGGRGSWKNWRISVRCGGWRLKDLIEKNLLPDPPRSRRRKTTRMPRGRTTYDPCPENYNVCVVCCRSGTLFCCDSCPKSFHKRCHIQRINAKSNPWFCIFCRIKKIQKNTSQNQSYQESEVLVRPMDHINGLKCKFLLLMIYSNAKSSFFVQEPYHSREHEQDESWSLCLNTIKDKLCRNKYLHVGAFVRDMRLIVENYKTFYENQNIVTLGFQLEKDFEDNFKAMFSIQ